MSPEQLKSARRKRIRSYVQQEQAEPRPKTDEFSAAVTVMLGAILPLTAVGAFCILGR